MTNRIDQNCEICRGVPVCTCPLAVPGTAREQEVRHLREGEPLPPPGERAPPCEKCGGCREWGGNGLWHHAGCPTKQGAAWLQTASPAAAPTSQPNAAAQEQQAGWISVGDRLPETYQRVMVLTTDADDEPIHELAHFNGRTVGFLGDKGRRIKPVTYWQALDLPPAPTGMGSVGLPSGRGEEA